MFCLIYSRYRTAVVCIATASIMTALPARADDVACSSTSGTNLDTRSFPTTQGDTVLNGRQDGSPDACIIFGGGNAKVDYPNGMTVNTNGTLIDIRNTEVNIVNGLTVSDANNGTGLVSIKADRTTRIAGQVNIINQGKLKLNPSTLGSSTTRLYLNDAYFSVEAGSELQVAFDLDRGNGKFISVGAFEGDGNVILTNTNRHSSAISGTLSIHNSDGNDYTYSGNIIYDNQSLPHISKQGSGTFTFTGDVNKATGDTLGFTDGLGLI